MKNQDDLLIVNLAKQCARYSLAIGTLIFMCFAISHLEALAAVGFIFTLTCVAVNGIILMILLLHLLLGSKQHRQKIFHIILLMLLNVPIAILYFWLTVEISQLYNLNL